MTEVNPEITQTQDLGARRISLAPSVIELLGEENLIAMEGFENQAGELLKLTRLLNPFETQRGQNESLLTPEECHAIAEVRRVDDIEDIADPEIIEVSRAAAPILAGGVERHEKFIRDQYNAGYAMYKAIMAQRRGFNAKDTDAALRTLSNQLAMLEEIASDLFTMTTVNDFKELAEAEDDAAGLDAKTVGIQKKPELGERLRSDIEEAARLPRESQRREELVTKYANLTIEVEDLGRRSWKVRHAHRSPRDIDAYGEIAKKTPNSHRLIRQRGTIIHRRTQELAANAALYPSRQMLDIIFDMKKRFIRITKADPSIGKIIGDEEMRYAALAAEAYITEKANLTESYLRSSGFKFDAAVRKAFHFLKEEPLRNWIKRAGGTAIGTAKHYESIPPDPNFRKSCRDARDILAGGGRIDHPQARYLAETLHKLRFGKKGDAYLEADESGILVGVIADKISSLTYVIARFEEEVPDEQVQKLRVELPEQYRSIADFDIDRTLDKLKGLLEDSQDSQILLSCFEANDVRKIRKTIEHLWNVRNQIAGTYENGYEEVSPEEENTVVAGESPQFIEPIIDIEMVEIAEQLDWVVFPAGASLSDIRDTLGENSVDLSRVNWDRIKHLLHLAGTYEGKVYRSREPKLGTSVPYLVAEFGVHGHNFAVAECPEIGNATYVVNEGITAGTWEELMQLSKAEARSLGARRIIHPKEEGHLNKIIRTINSLLLIRSN